MDVISKLNAIAKIGVSQRALAQRLNISETTQTDTKILKSVTCHLLKSAA